MADDYRGLPGAYVFAFRRSESYVLRSYVVTSALVGVFVAIFLMLALFYWLGTPAPFGQQALLGVIGIFFFLPLFTPVLVAARRHRRGIDDVSADALIGLTGYVFLLAIFLAMFISDPNAHEVGGLGPLTTVLLAIDALPRAAWVVPLLVSVGTIVLAIRYTRPDAGGEGAGGRASEANHDETEG